MNAARFMLRSAVLAGLLAASACALFQQPPPRRDPSLLSTQPAPPGRACRVVATPESLPSPGALVDSASLTEALHDLRAGHQLEDGYALLSMSYDQHGTNIRRSVIEHSLTPAAADSLQKLVFAHRRVLPAGEEVGVRLRIDLGTEVELRVGRQEYCEPRSRDVAVVSAWSAARQRSPAMDGRDETVWVRVFLDARGSVNGARIERGILGTIAESQIFNYVSSLSFDPALLDGHAVSGTTVVPIVVRRR
jgi:hypothetical protein